MNGEQNYRNRTQADFSRLAQPGAMTGGINSLAGQEMQAKREPEILRELNRLGSAIATLEKMAHGLREDLSPVRAPCPPEAVGPGEVTVAPVTDIGGRLRAMSDDATSIAAVIRQTQYELQI